MFNTLSPSKHIIISVDAGKEFDENLYSFIIKTNKTEQFEYKRGTSLSILAGVCDKDTASVMLSWESCECVSFLILNNSVILTILIVVVRKEKVITEGTHEGWRTSHFFFFAEDRSLFTGKPKNSTKRQAEPINATFRKV